jgi:hypothetical protein
MQYPYETKEIDQSIMGCVGFQILTAKTTYCEIKCSSGYFLELSNGKEIFVFDSNYDSEITDGNTQIVGANLEGIEFSNFPDCSAEMEISTSKGVLTVTWKGENYSPFLDISVN